MGRARILVVDDESGMLRSMERVLAPQHEVKGVRTPAHALEVAAGFEPDLAILDIRMPEMDGFSLMGELKARHPGIDVILMTGSVNEPDARLIRALREKAFYFIHKPFERDVLLTLVHRCLEVRRLAEENRRHVRRLEDELDAARSFQLSLLPEDSGRSGPLVIAARYLPCVELCGDFYDYAAAGEDDATLIVTDVSGHGASAAMLTGMIKLAFRSAAEEDYAPASVVRRISESLPLLGERHFITAICVRVRGHLRRLEYANAGHPPGFLIGANGAIVALESTGPIVHTALHGRDWEERMLSFSEADRLFLYTDGLTEAASLTEHYGRERLEAELGRSHDGGADLVDSVLDSVTAFRAGRPQDDDVAVVVARPVFEE